MYKSSFIKCFFNFIRLTIWIGLAITIFLCVFLYFALEGELGSVFFRVVVIRSAIFSFGVGAISGAYLAFYTHNIRMEVLDDAIAFFRFKREYVYLPFESFVFASNVHKNYYESIIPVSTTRYLRVFLRYGGRGTDYRCHNFSRKTFESFMAHAKSAAIAYEQASGRLAPVQESENWIGASEVEGILKDGVLSFQVIKRNIGRYRYHKQVFWWLTIPFFIISVLVLAGTPSEHMAISIGFCISLFLFPIFMGAIPLIKYVRHTPERIELHSDRLVVDDESYYFSEVQQIRMTTIAHDAGAALPRIRKIHIVTEGYSRMFILGDTLDDRPDTKKRGKVLPKAFPEYGVLFSALAQMFQDKPDMFVPELG